MDGYGAPLLEGSFQPPLRVKALKGPLTRLLRSRELWLPLLLGRSRRLLLLPLLPGRLGHASGTWRVGGRGLDPKSHQLISEQ